MTDKRWTLVQELFDAAVKLDEAQWASFLQKECKNDDVLQLEVLSLLQADRDGHPLLDEQTPLKENVKTVNFLPQNKLIGKMLAEYRILDIIATGGMGTVYKAQRADGAFEQEVALKVIHQSLQSASFVERFRQERQILASLNHPNIAHLMDGGITDDGLPFLVMEMVIGKSLDEYLIERTIPIEKKLRVFLQICEAVNYAHSHLIIHRDLKPGNIFITAADQVKLLDFGIAKVFDPTYSGGEADTLTRDGRAPFTPEYAAPEQINGEEISTATDVYALGVILYEMLTGKRPYEFKTNQISEIQHIISQNIPRRPSTIVRENKINGRSGSSAKQLSRQLRGDLDNICLKALKKEPQLRYENVEQLRNDLSRHLKGLPVRASGDFRLYRFRKFIQRHLLGVSLVSGFLITIIIIIFLYTAMLKEQTLQAQKETRKAQAVSDFLGSLFEAASPEEARGKIITAQDLLSAGAVRIENDLANEPEVQATMLYVIGDVYRRISNFDRAEMLLLKALERNETTFGLQSLEVVEATSNLGELYLQIGQYEKSALYLDRAINLMSKTDKSNKLLMGELFHRKADLVYEQGEIRQADSLYSISQRIYVNYFGHEHELIADILNARASVARHNEDFETAEILYRQALEMRRKIFGDDHPDVAHTLNHLGRLMYKMGKYRQGESYAREGLALRQKIFGMYNPETGASMSNLAHILFKLGKYEEAALYYRQVSAVMDSVFLKPHPYKALTKSNLGNALYHLGQVDEAEIHLRFALEQLNDLLPEGHVRKTSTMIRLGILLLDRNETTKALPFLEKAYKIRLKSLSRDNLETAEAENALGYCLAKMGQYQEAEVYLSYSHKLLQKLKDTDNPLIKLSVERIAYLNKQININTGK